MFGEGETWQRSKNKQNIFLSLWGLNNSTLQLVISQ